MQGQRLHLSIYHPDWLAKSTSAPPPIPLPLCHSLTLGCTPTLSQPPPAWDPGLTLPPARPSIFAPLAIYLSFSPCRPFIPPSLPLSPLCVCLSVSFPAPSILTRAASPHRTRLKCPEGARFKHRNQKHMAHFQLPRSITAIYPEIAAKFPKVSSRFTADCNACLSHFLKNQASLLSPRRTALQSDISKAFEWLSDTPYLCLSCAPSPPPRFFSPLLQVFLFFPPQLCWVRVPLCNANLITCKLEISPDPSK